MAVSTSSYFNNGIAGQPMVGGDVDIYEKSATPKYAVGQKWTRSDGAEFMYAHFGANVSKAGLVVAQDFSESGTALVDAIVIESGSTTAVADESINPGTAGSRYVQVKLGGATQDQFAGGYLLIADGAGEGFGVSLFTNAEASGKTDVERTNHLWNKGLTKPSKPGIKHPYL